MIEMWDEIFAEMNPEISELLADNDGNNALELMHRELDKVWEECYRCLIPGGILCINTGDATRTIDKKFQMYSNHSRILQYCVSLGFQNLPNILWRKPTNSPTKFMGSGMLPPGAYVTLEHEHILVLRKGGKRLFKSREEKQNRRESAFFWEERNEWFSDIWMGLKGTGQLLSSGKTRERSGAFPLELAYRLINMFSVKGDTVLDPFLGTGTTLLAAVISERNSIGYEIDPGLSRVIRERIQSAPTLSRTLVEKRLQEHQEFVNKRQNPLKYRNHFYHVAVVSRQETDLIFRIIREIRTQDDFVFQVEYSDR